MEKGIVKSAVTVVFVLFAHSTKRIKRHLTHGEGGRVRSSVTRGRKRQKFTKSCVTWFMDSPEGANRR